MDRSGIPNGRAEDHEAYLGRISSALLPKLWALHDWEGAARARACSDVGSTREWAALGYVVPLLDDPLPAVRSAAVAAMAALGDPRGARAVGRALLDEAAEVRAAAGTAAAKLGVSEAEGRRLATSLRGPYGEIGRDEPFAKAATADQLEAAWRGSRGRAYDAATAIAKRRKESWAVEQLFELTAHPWGAVRAIAVRALSARKGSREAAAFAAFARDCDPEVAEAAVSAVGVRRLATTVPDLIEALHRPSKPLVEAAAQALGRIRGRPALEGLVAALPALSPPSRRAVIRGLGASGDLGVVVVLIPYARDETPFVREEVARALGTLGEPMGVTALEPLLRDSNLRVRQAATAAMSAIGSSDAIVALEKQLDRRSEDDRLLVLAALKTHRSAVPALASCLRDRSARVRFEAAQALVALGDEKGTRALLAAARTGDGEIARGAWQWLVERGDPGTVPALEAMLARDQLGEFARQLVGCGQARLETLAKKIVARRGGSGQVGNVVRWASKAERS